MRMSKGVEWAMHTLLNLDMAGDAPVSSQRLASAHGLPAAYLNKQLQHLVRAGLLESTAGPKGGFRLAKSLDELTLLDVVQAIEGDATLFQCDEIRCGGKIGELSPPPTAACAVKAAMHRADEAWRLALRSQRVSDIRARLDPGHEFRDTVRSVLL
ncbi:HTH-type transcriptional repressor NsrR [Streptomyces sp. ADI93-02]|nr:HTH-type transcriptional repressor NsrR [Streptomyces sp. ADI93-02]